MIRARLLLSSWTLKSFFFPRGTLKSCEKEMLVIHLINKHKFNSVMRADLSCGVLLTTQNELTLPIGPVSCLMFHYKNLCFIFEL